MTAGPGAIVKAYDIRGVVGEEFTALHAEAIGMAFARLVRAPVVVGRDMRDSGRELSAAFIAGVRAAGFDVVDIGLCSTDQLYFASGLEDLPGAMFTASHNPGRYNGIKLCRAGAAGLSLDTGLAQIRDDAEALLAQHPYGPARASDAQATGRIRRTSVADGYADRLHALAPLPERRPLRIVVDAGNGMAGLLVSQVFGERTPSVTVEGLYLELDGSFPNHEANPLEPANLVDLQAAVPAHGADLGLAFDGDADRCFVIDERGEPVSASSVAALVGVREVRRAQQEGESAPIVLHNLLTSRVVPDAVAEAGGRSEVTKVGHSLIKAQMRATGAVFAGEHSAHYYFRDFYRADSGMLAALHVMSALAETDGPLSELMAPYNRYATSPEINSSVADAPEALARIARHVADGGFGPATTDEFDGLTVTAEDRRWWFNVRSSNTEPLLRLNAESADPETTRRLTTEVLALISP